MANPLTDRQLRILLNARDGIEAPACVFRPISHFLDVEELVRAGLLTAHGNAIALTPHGANRLFGEKLLAKPSWSSTGPPEGSTLGGGYVRN
jgi:hypothetical protein